MFLPRRRSKTINKIKFNASSHIDPLTPPYSCLFCLSDGCQFVFCFRDIFFNRNVIHYLEPALRRNISCMLKRRCFNQLLVAICVQAKIFRFRNVSGMNEVPNRVHSEILYLLLTLRRSPALVMDYINQNSLPWRF